MLSLLWTHLFVSGKIIVSSMTLRVRANYRPVGCRYIKNRTTELFVFPSLTLISRRIFFSFRQRTWSGRQFNGDIIAFLNGPLKLDSRSIVSAVKIDDTSSRGVSTKLYNTFLLDNFKIEFTRTLRNSDHNKTDTTRVLFDSFEPFNDVFMSDGRWHGVVS